MLTVWEAIKVRRSIRSFAPKDVPQEIIDQMLETARLAPSGSNRQPWRFLVVRDPDDRRLLRRVCADQKFIEEAPVDVICFGDIRRYSSESIRERWQEFINTGTINSLSGRLAEPDYLLEVWTAPQPQQDVVRRMFANTYIAITHMVLMATALGVGTCWVGGFTDAPELNRHFDLPHELVPVSVIAVGFPAGEQPPPRPRLRIEDIVILPGNRRTSP